MPASFASNRYPNKGNAKEYWKSKAPVLKKADYNGELLVLPKIAMQDEPQVTVWNVILERMISMIKNHQGGSKVNGFW